MYGLLGPNGSGKTTLLRMLAGVLQPTAGKIEIDRNSIGYLPQKFGCFPELTVKEQLEYFACLKKIPKKLHEEEIDRVLDIIHLSDRKKDACRKLSGGMVRRMGIAQALLGNPKILLLDEPTVGLDPEERNHFHSIIYKIKGKMSIIHFSPSEKAMVLLASAPVCYLPADCSLPKPDFSGRRGGSLKNHRCV